MLKPLFAAGLLIVSAPAIAQTQDQNPTQPVEAKEEKKICEVHEVTGSRLGTKKICMTPRQWDDQRRAHRSEVERAQQNSGTPRSN
ncbi:MAG TPA: hypothetical protein VM346_08530 [Sphingomicrobium sp.]|nr:hypothetical protein [Sphingomicrobium sp.]